jgi:mRNA interferase RelE/StbE
VSASMSYELQFLPSALKEWHKLGATLQTQFRKKLAERLVNPRVASDALHGLGDHYKIKLRAAGYRMIYRVDDKVVTVTVVAVGKREKGAVYVTALGRKHP